MKFVVRSCVVPALVLSALISTLAANVLANPGGGKGTGNYQGQIGRPLHFRPEGRDFVVVNGPEFFNRSLYGVNSAFRIDGGDKPEFSLYLPGRGGNLRLGIKTASGAKWLNDAQTVTARYRAGSMRYEVRDPLLGDGGVLTVAALPMSARQGLIVRAELQSSTPTDLIWAFGGASGDKGSRNGDIGAERVPVSQLFQLRPEQCRGSVFTLMDNAFALQGAGGAIAGQTTPGVKLVLADASKWGSASDLLASAGQPTETPVIVGQTALHTGTPLLLGLHRSVGGAANPPEDLAATYAAAEKHRAAIADKIVVDTPDPYINAAVPALCVAADSVWDESQGAFMHGGVAWRVKLLGWRGPYSADELGWHDRATRNMTYWAGRQNTGAIPAVMPPEDPSVNLSRDEPALHSNGDMSGTHYDMNLVYIDALFRHFLWTGDLTYARKMWPTIQRHLAWERRLFRRPFGPTGLPLYEAYCCIWASDDLQYEGGGVTHSTAYNYYHNKMAARMARLLHEDPTPYDREAALILQAMHKNLWLPDRGWYAEYKDLLGLQLVHPEAGLWTFYHTLDSEAVTPTEAWQMTRFVDTSIPHIPVYGPGVPTDGSFTLPTTTWMPYQWSTNNVVMAESAHTALAYWQAGRGETAFRLYKGALLDSMYLGLCPGNVGMCTEYDDARRESQRDFADGVGMTSRALVEGLFGVHPDALAGELRLRPGFPSAWDHAALTHPDFSFTFRRTGLTDTYTATPHFPRPMALRLQVAARRDGVGSVTVNGKPAAWRLLPDSVGAPEIEVSAAAAPRYDVRIVWAGQPLSVVTAPAIAARGGAFAARFGAATVLGVADPQGALRGLTLGPSSFRATAAGALGARTVFARLQQGEMTWRQPVMFEVRPAFQILDSERQDPGHLRFAIQNNTGAAFNRAVTLRVGGQAVPAQLVAPAIGPSVEIVVPSNGLSPGACPILADIGGKSVRGTVTNWKIKAPETAGQWDCVDMTPVFNDQVTQIFQNKYLSPRSPYCSLAMPTQGIGGWCEPTASFTVNDSGLRRAAGGTGILTLPEGIPLRTPGGDGVKNIAFTSQWDNYPRSVSVPLTGQATHAYLLMAGSTNSMQSRLDNGEVIVTYADGTTGRLALNNPTNWWPIDQDYLIDDYAFRRPGQVQPRVDLGTGMVRVLDAGNLNRGGKVTGGAATVLDLPLDPAKPLRSLTVRALANEVVIGLMSVTLDRPRPLAAQRPAP